MTLNLSQRSPKITRIGGKRKPVYDFVYALNSNIRFVFNGFGDIAGFVRPGTIFPYPTPIPAKIWGVPFEVHP